MPEKLIDLLRHGEAEGGSRFRGRADDMLTRHGWAQLQAAVAEAPPWGHIISSPAKRCALFARNLAEAHNIPYTQEACLWEMDFGDWEGLTAAEIAATDAGRLSAFWRDPPNHPPPGGESFQRFQRRVLDGWNRITGHPARHLLLITHGGPIRLILAEVLGMPVQNLMRLEVPHASLSRLRISTDETGFSHCSLAGHNLNPMNRCSNPSS